MHWSADSISPFRFRVQVPFLCFFYEYELLSFFLSSLLQASDTLVHGRMHTHTHRHFLQSTNANFLPLISLLLLLIRQTSKSNLINTATVIAIGDDFLHPCRCVQVLLWPASDELISWCSHQFAAVARLSVCFQFSLLAVFWPGRQLMRHREQIDNPTVAT